MDPGKGSVLRSKANFGRRGRQQAWQMIGGAGCGWSNRLAGKMIGGETVGLAGWWGRQLSGQSIAEPHDWLGDRGGGADKWQGILWV